jgi:hypothetical protein
MDTNNKAEKEVASALHTNEYKISVSKKLLSSLNNIQLLALQRAINSRIECPKGGKFCGAQDCSGAHSYGIVNGERTICCFNNTIVFGAECGSVSGGRPVNELVVERNTSNALKLKDDSQSVKATSVKEQVKKVKICPKGPKCVRVDCGLRHVNDESDPADLSQIMPGLVKVPFNLMGHEGVDNNGYLIGTRQINFCPQSAQSAPVVAPAPPKKSYVEVAAPAPIAKSSPAPAKAASSDVVIAKRPLDTPIRGAESTEILRALSTVTNQVNGMRESMEIMNNNFGQTIHAVNYATGISVSASMTLAQQAKEMKDLANEARSDIAGFAEQLGEAIQVAQVIEKISPMSEAMVRDISSRLVTGK